MSDRVIVAVALCVFASSLGAMGLMAWLVPTELTGAREQFMDTCERVAFSSVGFMFGHLARSAVRRTTIERAIQ